MHNDAWPSMHVSVASPCASLSKVSKSLLCTVHRRWASRFCRRVHRASRVAEGRDPGEPANAYLIEYCNNEDTFGTTAVRPGGFLSQLDSQALLTYDVTLAWLLSPCLCAHLILTTMTLACARILRRAAATRTWTCLRSATRGCGLARRYHCCAPRATQPKGLVTANAQMDRHAPERRLLMPTARWRAKTTDG